MRKWVKSGLKECFDAFPDHQNQVLKKKNFTSGVDKKVF